MSAMKRTAAALLWFLSGLTLGDFIGFVLPTWGIAVMPGLGLILGAAAAAIFVGDPRHLIWSRPTSASPVISDLSPQQA